jgi:succinoglycan biosynthesis protein ExoA
LSDNTPNADHRGRNDQKISSDCCIELMIMDEKISATSAEFLFVSVILPVRNEDANIQRILEQIFDQDYPQHRLEVIVVDGQSEDRTADFASSFSSSNRAPVVMRLSERGRAQGLNRGIQAAKGEVIVRVDARTFISKDYISRCVETLIRTGADNVGGIQKPISESLCQEAVGLSMCHPFGVGNAQFRLGRRSGFVDSVYLGCFRREIFNRVGLFDEQAAVISEDSDMNQRIRAAGGTVYLNTEIEAYFYPRETFGGFWNLYYRYGGARVGNLMKHRSLTSWRQMVPPVFLLAVLSSAVLTLLDYRFVYLLGAILALYMTVSVFFSNVIAFRKRKLVLVPLLMCSFACMHFGYAHGFWKRLLIPEKAGRYWGN